MKPIVINFIAGPGVGKSTLTASIFARLKKLGIDCELVTEYAKDKVWEESFKTLNNQIYVFGKQYHRLCRVSGKVECIVTDAPLIHNILYNKDSEKLNDLVIESINKFNNLNLFVERVVEYNENGRIHTLEQAKECDKQILDILNKHNIEYITVNPYDEDNIVEGILFFLKTCNVIK